MKILFVTWDGPQVSYLESLFLPIFRKLANTCLDFHILQFTWGDTNRIEANRRACAAVGFTYQAVTIWRRPLALGGLLTALYGARLIYKAVNEYKIDVVMPRSTLPALATLIALRGKSLPIIFDADGLPLDERVDFAGQSPSSLVHRFLRDVETRVIHIADVVLTRSSKAIDILHARAGAGTQMNKFHVVSNGRDEDLFKPADATARALVRRTLNLGIDTPLLVYAGSVGPQYCMDKMFQFFAMVHERRPDAHLLILTGSPKDVQSELNKHPQLYDSVTTSTVSAQTVPQYLDCADLGLAFRQPSFSMQAVAPIKLGEYLLCGLPVVATDGIGDTTSISADVGILLQNMDEDELQAATNWFINSVLPQRDHYRINCRTIGLNRFSLNASTISYLRAFKYLESKP